MAGTALLTALMWAPDILNILSERGAVGAMTRRAGDDPGQAAWAVRARRAHLNALENLAVFAPLAIGVRVTGTRTETAALAALLHFWVRIAHFAVSVAGVAMIRTLLFVGGVACQVTLGFALLTAAPLA